MRRLAKISYDWSEFVAGMVEEGINIETMPSPVCYLYDNKEVQLSRCLLECVSPCSHFFDFEFVTNICQDEDCTNEYPCVCCLEQIAEQKLLMRCILATSIPHTQLHVVHHKPPPVKYRHRWKKLMRRK